MSKYQRTRGATFEREIANDLTERLGRVVRREIGQARDGGCDIKLGPFRIEAKRRARISVYEWMEQAEASCGDGETPVVVCRGDGKKSLAIMPWEVAVKLMAGEL